MSREIDEPFSDIQDDEIHLFTLFQTAARSGSLVITGIIADASAESRGQRGGTLSPLAGARLEAPGGSTETLTRVAGKELPPPTQRYRGSCSQLSVGRSSGVGQGHRTEKGSAGKSQVAVTLAVAGRRRFKERPLRL